MEEREFAEEAEITEEEATSEETAPETQDGEDAEETEEESGEDTEEEPREEKPKKGIQRRFSELTAQRKAAEAYAQRLEEQNRQLMELFKQNKEPEQQKAQAPQAIPDKYDFENEADYHKALNAYMDDQFQRRFEGIKQQEEQRRKEQEEQQRSQTLAQSIDDLKVKGSQKFEDFLDVAFIPNSLVEEVISAENAADIAYRLGKNPKELQEITDLAQKNPRLAALKIGRMDAEISHRAKKTTGAPPPPKPVGGRADTTADPDKLPISEWIKQRESGKL